LVQRNLSASTLEVFPSRCRKIRKYESRDTRYSCYLQNKNHRNTNVTKSSFKFQCYRAVTESTVTALLAIKAYFNKGIPHPFLTSEMYGA